MDNITGKDILLVCEHFYNYDVVIKNELLRLGAKNVYLHNVKWFPGSFREKITIKTIIYWIRNPFARSQWTEEFKASICDKHFDTFLCIPIPSFKKDFLNWLRDKNPNIKTILFLWDKQNDIKVHFHDYFSLFDKVFSFDRDDAERYRIEYYPDFYLSTPTVVYEKCKYDISFVGTCNSTTTKNRAFLIDKIQTICQNSGLTSFLYLRFVTSEYTSTDNKIKRLKMKLERFKNFTKFRKYFYGKTFYYESPITLEEVNKIYKNSRAILDISHPNRQGLTINAVTALALGKKLITTNYRIKNESFYDSANILIIDKKHPQIDSKFFMTQPKSIDMSSLRLDNWLKNIINY